MGGIMIIRTKGGGIQMKNEERKMKNGGKYDN
jgi:hypothetical protein